MHESSISATAGTDFLESCVGQSATVSELQEYPGNNCLIAHNSNPGFISCCDPLEELYIISAFIHQFLAYKHTTAAVLSNQGINFATICCIFKSSFRIEWHVPYKRLDLPAIYEMAIHQSSFKILQTFSTFSSVQPLEG
jgi:hypothetical protein